jgi:hypothetical protein
MELYIQIEDDKPVGHPIFGDNFREAFPDMDTNNLPYGFAKFVRVAPPALGPYEKNQTVSYQFIDGVYTDVFSCEPMTPQEIQDKQTAIKDAWQKFGPPSWVFNENTCSFEPPVPMPTDGKAYGWSEKTQSWVAA